jgi:surfeit locus 1 family protein
MQATARRPVVSIGLLALALVLSALLIALGMWQLQRAEEKRTTLAEFERRGTAAIVDLNRTDNDDAGTLAGYRATATGYYLDFNILLDNQLHQGRTGYLVYTVFELDDRNPSILVNRGWIGAEADRSQAPRFDTPTTSQRLDGRLSQPPATGLRFEGSELIERMTDDMWRVQHIDFPGLITSLGEDLLVITLLLDNDAPAGFIRAWTPPGSDEARNLGYAFQWFAMALAVMVIAVVITLQSYKSGST